MSKHPLLIAALLILAAYLALAATSTVWGTDEPRFSGAAVNMVRSGNYLYATFNGEVRAYKPIMVYWLMSVPVRLFGPTAFACRFWSPVGAALACLLTGLIGRRLFDERTGLMAMVCLALSPLMIQCGAAATVDAVLLAVIVGAMLTFVVALQRGPSVGHYALLLVLTAAALLLKGPAGLLVPVFIIPPTWWLLRRQTPLRFSYLVWVEVMLLLGVGVFLIWALPANRATAGIVLHQGISEHVVGRALHPMEGHGTYSVTMLPYYLLAILAAFFPWTLYLPGAISATLGRRLGSPLVRGLLIGWTIPVLGLLTVVATKLPHYALPVWPALALAVAAMCRAATRGELAPRDEAWLRRGVWFMAPVGVLLAVGLAVWPWLMPTTAIRLPAALIAVVFLAMTILAVRYHRRGSHPRAFGTLAVGMALFFALAAGVMAPALEQYKIGPAFARLPAIQSLPRDMPMAASGYRRSELVFSLDRGNIEMLMGAPAVDAWVQQPQPGLLFISDRALRKLEERLGPQGMKVVAEVEGLDFEEARWVKVLAVERPGHPPTPPASPAAPASPPAPAAPPSPPGAG